MDSLLGSLSNNIPRNANHDAQVSSRNVSNPWSRDRKHPTDSILSITSQRKHHVLLGSDEVCFKTVLSKQQRLYSAAGNINAIDR